MAEETEIEVEESEDGSWNQITVPEEAGIKVEVSDEDVKEVAAEAAAQPEPIVEEPKDKNEEPANIKAIIQDVFVAPNNDSLKVSLVRVF